MRITIAAVGRLKDLERDLVDRYVGRFDAAGRALALGPLKVIELAESRAAGPDQRRADEAQRLERAVAAADFRIALDERGRAMTSADLARLVAKARDDGRQHMAFLIGGPDGHDAGLLASAGERLSLGSMTLPHAIARVVLAEQLYRSATIIAGHPYHRA